MRSAVYEGLVEHERLRPRRHRFRYRVAYLYLDLDELPGALDVHPLWSARRPAPAWFREADHFGRGRRPLAEAIRDAVAGHAGERPAGPIRLLTLPRTWGWGFNPVSFYYVFAPDGVTLRWFVADVTNTPWNERHAYILGPAPAGADCGTWHPSSRKVFHVSPFMPMAMDYRWTISTPGDRLQVRIDNHDDEGRLFGAGITLARRPLDRGQLGRFLRDHPWITAKVMGGIYLQALQLWLKRVPYVPHPGRKGAR
jgi:DUF1365 family protein